ncbi:MAG: DUF2029 domain-containing protein, partial [Planctomycetes bacterium]|nr:DUF2029 domain-containing protein [Planctomycetota bacterium]
SGLTRWQRAGLVVLLVGLVVFGGLVEFRSAFLHERKGDLGVFLRTAWAVRSGQADIYDITDDHGFHYLYPPLFAILLVPLADPPAGMERAWMLPYSMDVALWYLFSLVCLGLAVHWLASALEQTSSAPSMRAQPAGSRRWWALRIWPVLACLPPIGHTLMRGQVGLLLLLLLAGMTAALLRGRRWQAGFWLSGAICLKVIPAFLLLYPLWRRDLRFLTGCALGLVVGLALIPAAVFGPARTAACYEKWWQVMGMPGLGQGQDQSRSKELTEMTATDSQSLLVALHNTLHLDRETRPKQAAPEDRRAALEIGLLLTLGTLLAAGSRRTASGSGTVLFLGMLVLIMLLLSPVCHLHYFCLSVPLVMGLLAAHWEKAQAPHQGKGLALLLAVYAVANVLPHIPGLEVIRDLGLAMYGALLLWLVGMRVLWRQVRPRSGTAWECPRLSEAA